MPDPPPIWDLAPDARELRRRIAALGGDTPPVVVLKRPHYPGVPDPAFDKLVEEASSDNTVTSVFVLDGFWCQCPACLEVAAAWAEAAEQAAEEGARRAAAAIASSMTKEKPYASPVAPKASQAVIEPVWRPLAPDERRVVGWHVHGNFDPVTGMCGVTPGCPYMSPLVAESMAERARQLDSIQLGRGPVEEFTPRLGPVAGGVP